MSSPFAHEWLREHARLTPDSPFLGTPSGWTSYAELLTRVESLAGSLHGAGVGPGEVVLSSLPDGPASVAFTLAAQSLGAGVAELNREISRDSLKAVAEQTRARFAAVAAREAGAFAGLGLAKLWLVHGAEPNQKLSSLLGATPFVRVREDGALVEPGQRHAGLPLDERSTALLVYTSGSTGAPRAVVQSHRNLAANTEAIVEYLELSSRDRACLILPLFYCYGKSVLLTHLSAGASVFIDHRFMYPRVVLDAMRAEGCTGFAGVPLTFELLKRQLTDEAPTTPSLRYLTQAGGAMHPDTIDWVRKTFAPARLFVMYGQTEATARLSYLPPEFAEQKRGSAGRAIRGVELRVVSEAGAPLEPGTVGNVIASGPSITAGYFRDPAGSAEVLKDGWLWTGDLGYLDGGGFLFLTGRAKQILKLGGHRVSAQEIEEAIATHPLIAEVAVTGVADPVAGEAAVALVVRAADCGLSAEEIRRYSRERLAAYKVPRDVIFVDALPRTPNGKIARGELAKLAK